MKRPWHIWLVFGLCLAVLLAAMGWISLRALELDQARTEARQQKDNALQQLDEARRQAVWEEKIRLSLWRMDSALAPFVAQESARPYFAYSAFVPVDRAYSAMFNDRGGGEMLMPSPLLAEDSPNIAVHFQFEPDGQLTSPRVPTGSNGDLAVPQYISEKTLREAQSHLKRVEALVDRDRLLKMLPENVPEPVAMVISPMYQTPEQRLARQNQRRLDLENYSRDVLEFQERNQAIISNANTAMGQQGVFNQFNNLSLPPTDVRGVLMTPLWIDSQLILARRVAVGGREYVQGCLLDWPAVKATLLETVDDLLPEADLEPVTGTPAKEEAHMLAALPVRLIPGPPIPDGLTPGTSIPELPIAGLTPGEPEGPLSLTWLSLGAAWGCVFLAAVAVAALLLGVLRLSERRASFVSAVTHELRTPLTTFQMYSEMLAEGMVSDRQQQKQYLNTLRAESVRLTHLVENVLSYARLERGRVDGRLEAIAFDRLIEQMQDRLAGRAEHAGMELVVGRDDKANGTTVQVNVSAAEQILFNLVDNACKYAVAGCDKRIHLSLGHNGRVAEVRVRDHGPGVSPSARRRLFHPFSKSAQEAARTAPGVGLGLALSRRLARDMGGDLRLDEDVADGACFVFTLAAAARSGADAD